MQKFNITQGMSVWLRRLGNMGRKNVIYHGTIVSIEPHYFRVTFQWNPVCGRDVKFRMDDFECIPNERGEAYAVYPTVSECLCDAQTQEKVQEIQDALYFAVLRIEPERRPAAELVDQIYEMLASAGIAPAWKDRSYYDGAGNEICKEKENNDGKE